MATKVDICNIALIALGDQRITSIDDNNERARACKNRYDDVRDAVLRSYHWNCAVHRTSLVRDSVNPEWGFSYRYQLPSDCLRVLDVQDYEVPFEVEGRYILSDASSVNILYITNNSLILDETKFDSLLVQAIAMRLAMEIAETLTGRRDLRQDMTAKYQAVLAEARSADSAERGLPKTIESDVFVSARL